MKPRLGETRHAGTGRGAKPYLTSDAPALRVTANLISAYASLSLGRTAPARKCLQRPIDDAESAAPDELLPAFGACVPSTLLHLPAYRTQSLGDIFAQLPEGLRLCACHMPAHRHHLDGNYERSVGIIHGAQAMAGFAYVIPGIYLGIMESIDLMALKRIDEAKSVFMRTRQIALPDGLIEGFGEHHGLLSGLIEACLKRDYPEDYRRAIDITHRFSSGWRRLHGPITEKDVADNLTTTEFSVPMLINRGWTNHEVAQLLGVSENTIKYHLTHAYEKLHIRGRKELGQYMLR
ncbi:helix-turn-helix transcriptional regulator [Paratractidigestivibacter sp.]|uniref:helix-turn-helix transcriptional regulator n=1 Tax=Paratractidigestivibacter sp. TaxID=2847316 RepID=UPI002ACB131A|nr:helix-turn-helix transcriptional regulator [Paratractidigestivibacter sp.]